MRQVLRDRYIGAVLVGLLLYSCMGAIIRALQNPVMLWIQRIVQHSVVAGQPLINKGVILASLADAIFYLVFALLLGVWIYRPEGVEEAPKAS